MQNSNSRFSIRTLLNKMHNKPNTSQCLYLLHVSQLVRDPSGGESYTDSHYECNKTKLRITKKRCNNCVLYKPLIF